MSLFDILSAVSIGKNVNDPNTKAAKILKKMDSATLTILNGEALTYTNIGGRTGNTFGVNNNFQFDAEVFLEALVHKAHNGMMTAFSGFLLGPGSVNNVTVGNRNIIDWMPKNVHNFAVIRGGNPHTFLYGNELDIKDGVKNDTTKAFDIALFFFSAVIFGYDLVFNLGGQFNLGKDGGGLMSPVGDPKYIATKQAEIAANEKEQEELKKISEQQAASGTILSPDALAKQQHEQEHLEHNYHELESSLQKAEREKEWLIWTNIVIENKGIWVLKMLEYVKGSFVQVLSQIKKAKEDIGEAEKNLETATANLSTKENALVSVPQGPGQKTTEDSIRSEILELNNAKTNAANTLSAAKAELAVAEARLTFLKPPA
jgi:hypothetical protein